MTYKQQASKSIFNPLLRTHRLEVKLIRIVLYVCYLIYRVYVTTLSRMASQTYNVPVILPDLRKEESYSQIVDALEYLDVVANDIFYRISSR